MPTVPPDRAPFGGRESHQAREIAESFGSDPDRYDRARPRYPGALVDRIVAGQYATVTVTAARACAA